MKSLLLILLVAATLFPSCKMEKGKSNADSAQRGEPSPVQEPLDTASLDSTSLDITAMPDVERDTVAVGDLNGDHAPDTAWVEWPKSDSNEDASQSTRIRFSPPLPDLVDSLSVGGVLAPLEDLDENGTNELVFLPDWPTSCWAGLRVYGLQNGAWKMFGTASYYRCNDGAYLADSLVKRVIKIRKGVFDMIENVWSDSGEDLIYHPHRFTID